MKNYKKALLATMIVATMPLIAATGSGIIEVTTTEDEDSGEQSNGLCSLREAIITAEKRKSYGGCQITNMSTQVQYIQLKEGTYTLKAELTPKVEVVIYGKSPVDWQNPNVLINNVINQYPAPIELKTIITSNKNSRIFNTTIGKQPLTLSNIILKDAKAPNNENGGAIYAGSSVTLNSTQILNSEAKTGKGGAVYLAGVIGDLSVSRSLIQGNDAVSGSVVAMSGKNNLGYIKREINFTHNSIIENGSINSISMFDLTGEPNATLTANTIAKNIASNSTGNLIKFSGDAVKAEEREKINPADIDRITEDTVLSGSSSLSLISNTIVDNSAYTTLLYDKFGRKILRFNILAYNGGANTYACRYLLNSNISNSDEENIGLGIGYNAFSFSGNNKCDVPKESVKDNTTNIDVSNIERTVLLSENIIGPSEYTAWLPLYYPKNNGAENDLIDVSPDTVTSCSEIDQRGLARLADGVLSYDPKSLNTCDIGSVELMRLTAGDIKDLSNTSLSTLISGYQDQYDFFDDAVNNPNDKEYVTYYQYRRDKYKKILDTFNDDINRLADEKSLQYRAIYIDLQSYQLPLPDEIMQADGSHKIQFFDPKLYTVDVKPLGMGVFDENIKDTKGINFDPNLKCKWNPELQQIMMYRIDDAITKSSEKAYCTYTIIPKDLTRNSTTGLLSGTFTNIAPAVKDTSVTLKYKQNEKVALNLLDFANDDGDTGKGGKGPQTKPDKAAFWHNENGVELPIRLSNVPSKNLVITADRTGACPAPDQKETCYGGSIYIQEANNFNPFNYSFNYQVYDNDATPKISNTGTVNVISTATTTDDTRNSSSGGGGTGIFTLLGLFSLMAYRRYRKS